MGASLPGSIHRHAGPAEGAEMQAIGKRMAPAGMSLDLLAVVLIGLMVWKPAL